MPDVTLVDPTHPTPPQPQAAEDAPPGGPAAGIGLCFSGGGFRAMLFHVGALIRLNQFGLLDPAKLKRVSSVSGGSITAGTLGANWGTLQFNQGVADPASLQLALIDPIRKLANQTVDVAAVGWGLLSWRKSISDEVAAAYDAALFEGRSLQHLPKDTPDKPAPRFVINATNVQSGSLWRFSQPFMADYRVGMVKVPKVPLARAVAASSAFPPFLSPLRLDLSGSTFAELYDLGKSDPEHFTRTAFLTDGGVYDNLGLETVWKRYQTVLVSDGGRQMDADADPATDWAWHSRRLIDLLQNQTSNLRRRQLIGSYSTKERTGGYWGIQTPIAAYQLPDALPCPPERTQELALVPTRLAAMDAGLQQRLINWGYAACDASLRKNYFDAGAQLPAAKFPYPGGV